MPCRWQKPLGPSTKKSRTQSRSAYEKSPENHGERRRVGKNGLKLEKPNLESALKTAGEMMAGTAKRLQRDIRYTLAPPDKNAMRIGGNKTDVHTERPSAVSRPVPVRAPVIQKTDAQLAHAR